MIVMGTDRNMDVWIPPPVENCVSIRDDFRPYDFRPFEILREQQGLIAVDLSLENLREQRGKFARATSSLNLSLELESWILNLKFGS